MEKAPYLELDNIAYTVLSKKAISSMAVLLSGILNLYSTCSAKYEQEHYRTNKNQTYILCSACIFFWFCELDLKSC